MSDQRPCDDAARDLRGEAVPHDERLEGPADARGEGRRGHRLPVPALGEQEGQVRDEHEGRYERCDGGLAARPVAGDEPGGLGQDEEPGEVVRRERERGRERPAGEVPPGRRPQGTAQEEDRAGAEEDDESVGARLLRVPREERMHGDERRCDDAHPAVGEGGSGGVGDRDRSRVPNDRRERPQPDLAEPGHARPGPGEDVVEVRRRLGLPDRARASRRSSGRAGTRSRARPARSSARRAWRTGAPRRAR